MGLGVSWRQDGRELYYLAPKHAVMAVDVTASPGAGDGNATDALQRSRRDQRRAECRRLRVGQRGARRAARRLLGGAEGRVCSRRPDLSARAARPPGQSAAASRTDRPLRAARALAGRHAHRDADGSTPSMRADDPTSGSSTSPPARRRRSRNDAPPDFAPLWSPDGKQIFYVSARAGGYQGIYRKTADGTGDAELIYRYEPGAPVNLRDISADGKHAVVQLGRRHPRRAADAVMRRRARRSSCRARSSW